MPKMLTNISVMSWLIVLIFCIQLGIYRNFKLLMSFRYMWSGMAWHAQSCLKELYVNNVSRESWIVVLKFLYVVRYSWKIQINFDIFVWSCQACLGMFKIFKNNTLAISLTGVKKLSWFFSGSSISVETRNVSYHMNWVFRYDPWLFVTLFAFLSVCIFFRSHSLDFSDNFAWCVGSKII